MTLKVAFSVLYGLACEKDASSAANLEFLGDSNLWNVSFTRAAHDWDVDDFASFFFSFFFFQELHFIRVRR
jgi:hypothetical protein